MTAQNQNTIIWIHRFLMPALTGIIALATTAISIVGGQIWGEARGWMRATDERLQKLEIFDAATGSNRFTTSDWAVAKERLDADRQNADARISHLEASIPHIKESLQRIETKLDRLHP